MAEIGDFDRAFFVDEFLLVSDTTDNKIGYMSHPDAVAEQIVEVATMFSDNPAGIYTKIQNAYNWVTGLTWDGHQIGDKWIDIFNEIYFYNKFEHE